MEAASVAVVAVTVLVSVIFSTQTAMAQIYSVLYAFTGPPDGNGPHASLLLDAAGNLYGTTLFGGASYHGTAFKLDRTGKETVLYSFLGGYGENPYDAGLIRDERGNLYGTTFSGGAFDKGAIFKLNTKGNETVLHSFTGTRKDGQYPEASLILDTAGNLYGTTSEGGGTGCGGTGCGTVFKLDTGGRETVLYSFKGKADGSYPGGVIRDNAGNFYGGAWSGGDFNFCNGAGCGTVFKLETTGKLRVLYTFTGTQGDGASPGSVIRDEAGNLYGTTTYGGDSTCGSNGTGCGTVFMLDKAGKERVLYAFHGTTEDNVSPSGVIRDPSGNLYGTTQGGGSAHLGTVFKLGKGGGETVLYTFSSGSGGVEPGAGVILDKAGNLYGTTDFGGDLNCNFSRTGCGVVFKLAPR